MQMNDYFVGQLLYLVPANKLNIIPLQVVEHITRNTISGSDTTFLIQLPDDKKTTVDIEKIKGKIFNDVDTLKKHMINNATEAIEGLIASAHVLQKDSFVIDDNKASSSNQPAEKQEDQNKNDVQVDNNNDIIMVDLGNGVKAKMNTSNLDKVVNQ